MSGKIEVIVLEKAYNRKQYKDLIESMLTYSEPRLRRRFLQMIDKMKTTADVKQIADLLSRGRVEETLQVLNDHLAQFADETIRFYALAGSETATFLSSALNVSISFDQTNWRAVGLMRENRLRLIQQFTADQRDATRLAITNGITRGLNPIEQARAFRDSIGLTARQEAAVENYRRLLERGSAQALNRQLRDRRFDPTVAADVFGDRVLQADQINRIVERYRERYIQYRSETIARTESLRAVHESGQEAFKQAVDSGKIAQSDLVQEWITARDERVRDSHQSMNGQKVPFGQPFTTGSGFSIRYPGDPSAPAHESINCRCTVTTRIKGV